MGLYDRILLATDLSARSDRALDRAAMLAKREGAQLQVLHVIEPTPGNRFFPRTQPLSSLAAIARAQILHDLGDSAANAQILIEEGDPAEVIERVAREQRATLLVVGVARMERLGRFALGATVERLLRAVGVPTLIVTNRPRTPYQRVGVAVELSQVSREALAVTLEMFPGQDITALHVFQPLASYGASDLEQHRAQFREVAKNDFEAWLESSGLASDVRRHVIPRIEPGDAARTIQSVAASGAFDLVVLGSRGRGRVFELLIGSVAKRVLADLPCDALFVRSANGE